MRQRPMPRSSGSNRSRPSSSSTSLPATPASAAPYATYVAYGAADAGVAGSDVLDEEGRDLFEPLDLGIGRCRMIVAERADQPVDERAQAHLRVATKYPKTTRAYLHRKGITAEV